MAGVSFTEEEILYLRMLYADDTVEWILNISKMCEVVQFSPTQDTFDIIEGRGFYWRSPVTNSWTIVGKNEGFLFPITSRIEPTNVDFDW